MVPVSVGRKADLADLIRLRQFTLPQLVDGCDASYRTCLLHVGSVKTGMIVYDCRQGTCSIVKFKNILP
jgi:hypothetical protein